MKRLLAFLLIILLMLTAVGCKKETELKTVHLAEVTHSVFYAPLYAAINLGFFEDEGLKIELTNAGGADKAMAMLLSGQTDIGFMGPEASVYVANEGREDSCVIIGQVTKRDGSFLVGREPIDNFSFDMLRGKNIIGGRKGGMPEMTLEYTLRKNGIEPGVDVEIDTAIQFNLMSGAFIGGEGDFVTLFEPTATEVELNGQGHILLSLGMESGEIPYTAFMVKQSQLKTDKNMLEKFMRAMYRGQQWVVTATDEEIADAIMPSFPDTSRESLIIVAKSYRAADAWCTTPVMTKDSFERLLDVMEGAGELDVRPSYEKLVDNSIAEKVSKK